MKKIFQAIFLIGLAVSAVYAASRSYKQTHDKCDREWEAVYNKPASNEQQLARLADTINNR